MPHTYPPTILHLAHELQDSVPELNNTLKTLLGDNYKTEIIVHGMDSQRIAFKNRIESLEKAYLFLLAAVPIRSGITHQQIQEYHDFYLTQASSALENATHYLPMQEALELYTTRLVSSIVAWWSFDLPNKKSACQVLSKAEQYHLLTQEHPSLATLIPFAKESQDKTDTYLFLTINTPLNPFSEKSIIELQFIKGCATPASSEELPRWFVHLQAWEQSLLCYALQKIDLTDRRKIYGLPCHLRTLLGMANYSRENCYIIAQRTGKILQVFGSTIRSAYPASPDSYQLPEFLQTEHGDRNLQTLFADTQQKPLFIQTLLSPGKISALFTPDDFLEHTLRNSLGKLAQEIHNPPFIISNHTLNYARYYAFTSAQDLSPINLQQRITDLLKPLDPQSKTTQNLQLLLKNYRATLDSSIGSASFFDSHGRELFLSSLELIIFELSGHQNYSTCVTGKDCQAIALMHTHAMWLYHFLYDQWPTLTDAGENRENFEHLICMIYLSQHHQHYAAQNAPGAQGIANTQHYMPINICDRLTEITDELFFLRQETKMASNCDIIKIIENSELSPENCNYMIAYYLPAQKIPSEQQIRLLGCFTTLANDWHSWQDRTRQNLGCLFTFNGLLQNFGIFKSTTPIELQHILTTLQNKQLTPTKQLANLFYYFQAFVERSKNSSSPIQNTYQAIKKLAQSTDIESQAGEIIERLDTFIRIMNGVGQDTRLEIL